ncbi:MAG TPA: Glu/Leu/Phe/Val dehydrogenase [Bacteroidia bacterium]|nr:Glu/Leu/Phe/Val dehydrogenase [Bacteroidia bacterium]
MSVSIVSEKESKNAASAVLSQMEIFNHEQIVYCNDNNVGLKAIIGIHNTTLGPALGGTRMWNYASEQDALIDVLRLSRGMTYKSAVAGINLGGGKAVIIGDPKKIKTEPLLRSFGKFIDNLGGKYITAEDVSMNSKDMEIISMETDYVTGLPESMGGSGDPSPVTAMGVWMGMKASAKQVYGNDSLQGKKIIVQGLGNVGKHLIEYLSKENAEILVFDIDNEKIKDVSKKFKVKVLSADQLYSADADIYAPCALGATVNTQTLEQLKVKIICGSANNQLADENIHGKMVEEKGILYAPDFVVNAGGIINVYYELEGYNRERALAHAERIYDTTIKVFEIAKKENIPTYLAANRLAEDRINAIAKLRARL